MVSNNEGRIISKFTCKCIRVDNHANIIVRVQGFFPIDLDGLFDNSHEAMVARTAWKWISDCGTGRETRSVGFKTWFTRVSILVWNCWWKIKFNAAERHWTWSSIFFTAVWQLHHCTSAFRIFSRNMNNTYLLFSFKHNIYNSLKILKTRSWPGLKSEKKIRPRSIGLRFMKRCAVGATTHEAKSARDLTRTL